MNTGAGPLPVGVVIPCRNSAAYIPRHLEGLRGWIDLAEEVVVVDSASSDGTLDLLREGVRHPRIRFLDHPPGLYESWNFGIAHIEAPYTYIATVGDRITRAGVAHLVEVAQRFESDLVISPPRIVLPAQERPEVWVWPIHHLIEWLSVRQARTLTGLQAQLTTLLMSPSGLLGSSASNLYRTDLLKRCPFPTQYGHCGDTAWTLMYGLGARWALTPEVLSDFLVHPSDAPRADPERTRARALLQLAIEACRTHDLVDLQADVQAWHDQTEALWAANGRLRDLRRSGLSWLLQLGAWRARSRRNEARARLADVRRALMARLHDP